MNTKQPNTKLRAARERKGWSQKKVAEMVPVRESTYQNWELGVSFPHPENRLRLRTIFQASMDELGLLPGNDDIPSGTIRELNDDMKIAFSGERQIHNLRDHFRRGKNWK